MQLFLNKNLELHIAIIAQIFKRYFKEIPVKEGEVVGVDLPVEIQSTQRELEVEAYVEVEVVLSSFVVLQSS